MLNRENTFIDKRLAYTGFQGASSGAPMQQPKPLVFMSPALSDGNKYLSVSDCLSLFNLISHRVDDAVDDSSPVSRKRLAQECQAALLQLKEALLTAHARHWQLELDVFDARADRAALRGDVSRVARDGNSM